MNWLRSIGVCWVLLFWMGASQAHEGRPVHLELLQQSPERYQLHWRIPPVLADAQLPVFTLAGCEALGPSHFQPRLAGVRQYQCVQNGEGLAPDNKSLAARPEAVLINYPQANPLLSVLLQYQWLDGDSNTVLAGPSEQRIDLPEQMSVWAVVASYTYTGIDHILEGLDHLLFVSCLLMITLLGAQGNMRDGALLRLAKRVLLAVSGFTLGHSLTLALVTLAGLSAPSRLVETLIALSIMVMALEIAKADLTSWSFRRPVTIATAFGLLHGLGFAGALQDIGLPYQQEILALVFFNIGVELGQILFVLLLSAALILGFWLVVRFRNKAAQPQGLSGLYGLEGLSFVFTRGVGSLSAYWVVVRFLEL